MKMRERGYNKKGAATLIKRQRIKRRKEIDKEIKRASE